MLRLAARQCVRVPLPGNVPKSLPRLCLRFVAEPRNVLNEFRKGKPFRTMQRQGRAVSASSAIFEEGALRQPDS